MLRFFIKLVSICDSFYLTKIIVQKIGIAQATNVNYCPKQLWVCKAPAQKTTEHTHAPSQPKQQQQEQEQEQEQEQRSLIV